MGASCITFSHFTGEEIGTQEVKALVYSHTAEAWCSAGNSATSAWKQAIWSPRAVFTPTSLEGVFQPLSLNGPCQDQVTSSLSLSIPLGRSVLPISGSAFSFLSTPSPWPGAHTHVDQSQSPVELGAPGGQRPPLSIRGSMPVLPWWAPWRMSNSLSTLFMELV